jgi:hypothetical protein
LSGNSNVTGTVTFEQSSGGATVIIKGDLKGLDPNALRGFHIQYALKYISIHTIQFTSMDYLVSSVTPQTAVYLPGPTSLQPLQNQSWRTN